MHHYMLTITEEVESEYRSELKLWRNTDGEVWIQIGYDDNDPYSTQGMAITQEDAVVLINELSRLIGHVPQQIQGVLLKPHGNGEIEPKHEAKKSKAAQLTLTPPSPDPGNGQGPIPSKVNWNA